MHKFNAQSRSALRRAITRHDDWPLHRTAHDLKDASQLTVTLLNEIGEDMGLDVSSFDCEIHADRWADTGDGLPDLPAPEPKSTPKAKEEKLPMPDNHNVAQQLASTMAEQLERALNANADKQVDEKKIIDLIKKHGHTPAEVNVHLYSAPDVKADSKPGTLMHHKFPLLLSAIANEVNVMLVGPAGSGKTMAAEKAAEALGLDFAFTGAIDSPYKLSGFIDAQGRIVNTAFRRAYEKGGIFLFDEMDASLPSATLAFNAALANGHADFPDGVVKRHPDFRAVAACNTFGNGASRQYVGRNQQDAASLDRFAVLVWNYDERLECAILGQPAPDGAPKPVSVTPVKDEAKAAALGADWLIYVQRVRAAVEKLSIRHVVSPRASIMGTKLLAAGWSRKDVEESCLFKGLEKQTRDKLVHEAR